MKLTGLPLARVAKPPLRARFLSRPNRFTACVMPPDGAAVLAHLPDPGRLTGTLVPGCTVLLDGPYPPPRAYPYTLIAVQAGDTLVGTVPAFANQLFAALWRRGAFPELAGAQLASEVVHGRCRFDFQTGRTLVEVKSVTLAEGGAGLFPDAVTDRGARHCLELAKLARKGSPAALVFIAQRGDIATVAPAESIDPRFAEALRCAARAGVLLLACGVDLAPAGARSARRIPVLPGATTRPAPAPPRS